MARLPEVLNFRAVTGTTAALEKLADAERCRPSDIIRQAVESRLASVAGYILSDQQRGVESEMRSSVPADLGERDPWP